MKRFVRRAAACLLAALTLLCAACGGGESDQPVPTPQETPPKGLRAVTIHVAEGDAHLILPPDGGAVLIDTGFARTYETLAETLRSYGVEELDTLVITHPHKDHMGGAANLMAEFPVGQVYTIRETMDKDEETYAAARAVMKKQGITPLIAEEGVTFTVGGVEFEFLAPLKGVTFDKLNNYSAVVRFAYGKRTFLYMADVEKKGDKALVESGADLLADVIKVGNHGDKDACSKTFLEAAKPKVAIISGDPAADDKHAHEKTLEKLEERNIPYYITAYHGHIELFTDGEDITVRTQYK